MHACCECISRHWIQCMREQKSAPAVRQCVLGRMVQCSVGWRWAVAAQCCTEVQADVTEAVGQVYGNLRLFEHALAKYLVSYRRYRRSQVGNSRDNLIARANVAHCSGGVAEASLLRRGLAKGQPPQAAKGRLPEPVAPPHQT